MIPLSFVVQLEIVLLIVLTNGQHNPFFICHRHQSAETYEIMLGRSNEIVISDCENFTIIEQIIEQLLETALRGFSLKLYISATTSVSIPFNLSTLTNTTDLDLGANKLSEVNVENFHLLQNLNLTNNKIRSLAAIKLPRTLTLTSLDVSRNRLLKFEYLSIPLVRILYARSNNIFELASNLTLPDTLIQLDLTRNEIENLTSVRFRAKSLKILNLSINLINALSASTIESLPQLETLVLECNKIFDLEPGTFSQNVKLTELNLRDNNLSVLKKGVFDELINLQILDISKNNLLQLMPDTLQNLNNLIDFSVSENVKLCDSRCKHNLEFLLVLGGRLKTLKMDRLRLRKFPVTLTTSVRELDLSKNKLNAVQLGSLENFPYLRVLTLTGNEIEIVEQDVFAKMEFLAELRLDDNKLKRVPRSMPESLITIRLDENRISHIEKADFHGLQNLRLLALNQNSIQSVEPGSFSTLKNLQTLDISDNPILRLNTNAFDGPLRLRTFLATGLLKVKVNSTDIRYFPFSELSYLRELNLSRSEELVKSFLHDIPLLATVKELETLDASYANLTAIPDQSKHYLTRLQLLRLHGNPMNCTRNWFDAKEFDFQELLTITKSDSRLKVRVVRDSISTKPKNHDCTLHKFENLKVSKEQFWKNARAFSDKHMVTTTESANDTSTTAITGTMQLTGSSAYTISPFNGAENPSRNPISAVRKKLNIRSLHIAQFANQLANTTNATASVTNSSGNSSTNVVHIHSTTSSTLFEPKLPISTTVKTGSSAPSRHLTQSTPSSTSVTSVNITTTHATTRTKTTTATPSRLQTETLQNSIPERSAIHLNTMQISFSGSSTEFPSNTSFRADENNFHAVAISQRHRLSIPEEKGHYEPLVWNQTDEYGSFFDWFPGQNDSSSGAAAAAAAIGSDTAAEHSMKTDDNEIEYSHPGIVIFSVISCFLVVVFASVFASPYVQKYKWRRQRYKMSQFDNECQKSIEISSISAFVETEIPLE